MNDKTYDPMWETKYSDLVATPDEAVEAVETVEAEESTSTDESDKS